MHVLLQYKFLKLRLACSTTVTQFPTSCAFSSGKNPVATDRSRSISTDRCRCYVHAGGTMGVSLFFPYECNTEQVRMPASVGPFLWPFPFWPLDEFFWFFLLNLGSTAPYYSRRPLMRSSKAPPNQKNRGQFLPQPTRTHPSWHPNLLRVTLVGEE